ncbi:MAG: lysoplasmalogenase [Nitritalea sp.]
MDKKRLLPLYLFLIAALLDVYFTASGLLSYRYFSKPLIITCLLFFFYTQSVVISGSILRKSMVAALAFSLIGDILLLFPSLFLYGLGAFLMAHVSYIAAFKIGQKKAFSIENINFFNLFLYNLPIYIGAAIVYFLISAGLNELRIPVIIYLIVIVTMATTARERFKKTNAASFWQTFIGAILFMLSDALLALNLFFRPFEEAGVLVMGTYAIAQLLIVMGMREHFMYMLHELDSKG